MKQLPILTDEDYGKAEEIWGFSSKYLVHRYDEPKPIPLVHLEWWALFLSDHKQVAIAAPRESAKSSALTFAYLLLVLLKRQFSHVLLLGSNEKLASNFFNDIKIELLENDELVADYGVKKLLKDTETELICQFKDGHKFRVLAKGAGQRMRGIKWERKRPDLVLFDDIEDDEMVLNDLRRDKFGKWFYGTVRPMTKAGGKIRGVGTIIGFGSLLENMMPKPTAKDTIIEPLREYSSEVHSWVSVKYRAHDEDFSNILWEEAFSEKRLREIRKDYTERGYPDIYGQEYLNNPIDPTTAYFRKSDLLPMKDGEHEIRKTYYAASDFAIGERERNAYTVIIVGGMDSEGFLHIVDVRRGRWDGLGIVDEMISVQQRWEPDAFKVESENIAKSLGSFLYKRMDETQIYINIDASPPTKDKDKRGRSIQARTRAGKVKFDKEADWYPDLEEELLRYPKYQYKDQFDAFAWLGLMLEEMVEPQTDYDLEQEEYEQAYYQHMPQGRNLSTGY